MTVLHQEKILVDDFTVNHRLLKRGLLRARGQNAAVRGRRCQWDGRPFLLHMPGVLQNTFPSLSESWKADCVFAGRSWEMITLSESQKILSPWTSGVSSYYWTCLSAWNGWKAAVPLLHDCTSILFVWPLLYLHCNEIKQYIQPAWIAGKALAAAFSARLGYCRLWLSLQHLVLISK